MSSSLTLREVPPKPFSNIPFDIHIHLIDDNTGKLICGEDIPLEINLLLFNEDGASIKLNEYLVIDVPHPVLPRSGSVIFKATITTTSMAHGNNKFVLEIVPINHPYIRAIKSDPMTVITYELVISKQPPTLWYKDQGGRDNFMEMSVKLVDHRNVNVTARRVPLKMSLFYENGIMVPKQDILKVEGELIILERKGDTTIRFRIEEVSRSHQRQKFFIRISPDTFINPRNHEISSVETIPIEVMSKPRCGISGVEKKETFEVTTGLLSNPSTSSISIPTSISHDFQTSISHEIPIDKKLSSNIPSSTSTTTFPLPSLPSSSLSTSSLSTTSCLSSKKRPREVNVKSEYEDNLQSIMIGHPKLIEDLLKSNQTILSEYLRYSEQMTSLIGKLQRTTDQLQSQLFELKGKQFSSSSSSSSRNNFNSNTTNDNEDDDDHEDNNNNNNNNNKEITFGSYQTLMPPPLLSYGSLTSLSNMPLDLLAEAANEIEGRKVSFVDNSIVGNNPVGNNNGNTTTTMATTDEN